MARKTVRYHFCKGCGSYVGGPCLFCRIVGALERGVAASERIANAVESQAKGLRGGVAVNAEMLRILKAQHAEGQGFALEHYFSREFWGSGLSFEAAALTHGVWR